MSRWLKIDVTTPDKPAIRALATDCACSIGDAFLAFFRLYSWLDERTADGRTAATRADIDRAAWLDGCAASLERSGWLSFGDDGYATVANWGEHNGACARKRAQAARRLNELRDRRRAAGLPVRPCPRPLA